MNYSEIASRGIITEREIVSIKSELNRRSWNGYRSVFANGLLSITKEQTEKGFSWLLNQWKTEKGKTRKNNPFGLREQSILENFSRFLLIDYRDSGTGINPHFEPVYRVEAVSGSHFDYCVYCGVICICG